MSWSGESEAQDIMMMGSVEKWKTQNAKVDQTIHQITQLIDSTRMKFENNRRNHSDLRNIEKDIENLNSLILRLSDEINSLEKLIIQSNNQELLSRKMTIKKLRKCGSDQARLVQEICKSVKAELHEREMRRKKEISATSHELDFNETTMQHNQTMIIDDLQIKIVMEEQQKLEKMTRDIIKLEDMFMTLSNMVEEQGESVNRIELNVIDATEKVELAEQELGKAVNYKKSAMKKKMCIIGIVLAVLAVLALIIGLSVGLK